MADEKSGDRPLLNFEESLDLCLKPFKTEDEDVIQESVSVSFVDPISYMRIQSPCRTIYCDHVQCFDYNCYAGLNARRPPENWACPICRAKAAPELVYVDYIFSCLGFLLPQFEGATIYSSGSFEGKRPMEKKGESSVTIIDLVSDDETDQPETTAASEQQDNYVQKLHDFPALKDKPTMSIVQIKSSIAMRSILRLINQLSSGELKRLNGVGDKLAKDIVQRRPWAAGSEAELLQQLQSIKLVGKKKALNIMEQLKTMLNNTRPGQGAHPKQLQPPRHGPSYPDHLTEALDALRSLSQGAPVQQPPRAQVSHPQPVRLQVERPTSYHHRYPSHDPEHPSNHHLASSPLASHYYAVFPLDESATSARPTQSATLPAPDTVYIDVPGDVTSTEYSRIDEPTLDPAQSPTMGLPQEDTVLLPTMDYCAVFSSAQAAPQGQPWSHPSSSPPFFAITSNPEGHTDSPHKRPRTFSHDYHTLGPSLVNSSFPAPWPPSPGHVAYPPTSQPYQYFTLVQPQCSYAPASTSQAGPTSNSTTAVTESTAAAVDPMESDLFEFLVGPS